jgi:hypothetical protein
MSQINNSYVLESAFLFRLGSVGERYKIHILISDVSTDKRLVVPAERICC